MPRDEKPEYLTKKVAEVVWTDTHTEHGWTNNVPQPGDIHSIGFVLKDDETGVTLAESIDLVPEASRYGCTTAIPRSGIISVKYLRRK